jgi:hypothetical protein
MCTCNRKKDDDPLWVNPALLPQLTARAAQNAIKTAEANRTPARRAAAAADHDATHPYDAAVREQRREQPANTPDAIATHVKQAHETGLPPNAYDLAVQELRKAQR